MRKSTAFFQNASGIIQGKGKLQGPSEPRDLESLLLFAAFAGFPDCIDAWLGQTAMETPEAEAVEKAYRAAAQRVAR